MTTAADGVNRSVDSVEEQNRKRIRRFRNRVAEDVEVDGVGDLAGRKLDHAAGFLRRSSRPADRWSLFDAVRQPEK